MYNLVAGMKFELNFMSKAIPLLASFFSRLVNDFYYDLSVLANI